MGELLDRLRQIAPVGETLWKPVEAGDGVEGLIVAWERRTPDPAKRITDYPILHLVTDDGPVVWHAAAQVAQDELVRELAMVGDRIAVLFLGRHRTQSRNEIERYRVLVEPGRRHMIHTTPGTLDDDVLAARIRRTFARLFRTPAGLADDQLDDAEQWMADAVAGRVDLDPLQPRREGGPYEPRNP